MDLWPDRKQIPAPWDVDGNALLRGGSGERPSEDSSGEDPARDRLFRSEYDPNRQASTAVVEAVAAVTGREPSTLPPLHERIDIDALDSIVSGPEEGDERVYVGFAYAGVDVSVAATGEIVIDRRRE